MMHARLWLSLLLLLLSSSLMAAPSAAPKIRVELNHIEAKPLSKKSADKLYMNITYYSSLDSAHTHRVPEKTPGYWRSQALSEIKATPLWEGSIQNQEEIKLIFSLVEHDHSDWDLDDLIGSAQLVLSNKNGKIEERWELPVFEETTEMQASKARAKEPTHTFYMKNPHAQYTLSFTLSKPKPQAKANQSVSTLSLRDRRSWQSKKKYLISGLLRPFGPRNDSDSDRAV